jgi:two-component system, NtrC family, nitrogen regulation sensor histidine kinase NtrY
LINFLKKYWHFGLALLLSIVFLLIHKSAINYNEIKEIRSFQEKFQKTEKELEKFLQGKEKELKSKGIKSLFGEVIAKQFNLHVYKNDSLVFWNTNQLPILRFADIHYPSEGIVHLQNGWYYSKIITVENVQLAASFLLKKEYQYENNSLKNEFNPIFSFPLKGKIILDKENAYPIYNQNKQFVFAIFIDENQPITSFKSDLILLFLILSIGFLLTGFYSLNLSKQWILVVTILLTRIASLEFDFFFFLSEITAFQPSLYASSEWFPNFGEYLINSLLFIYFSFEIKRFSSKIKKTQIQLFLTFLLGITSLMFGLYIGKLYRGLVENSSINLEIERLFSLNFYSFLAIFSIGLLFYSFFIILRTTFLRLIDLKWGKSTLFISWLIFSILYIYFDNSTGSESLSLSSFFTLISGFIVLNVIYNRGKYNFGTGLFLLFLFSIFTSLNLFEFNRKKEISERELFANQLASDQDIGTEIEFSKISPELNNEAYLKKISKDKRDVGISEFKDAMERKVFNSFWERYDIDFYLFDANKNPIVGKKTIPYNKFNTLESIIKKHSIVSEIDSNIFFITDYTSQYNYIIKQKLYGDDSTEVVYLFCSLKSKKIPEKIGFPRLLISSNAKVFESLEKYSIAKYYNGKLVSKNGKFSYPSRDKGLTKNINQASGYFDSDGYNHYLLRKTPKDLIVLSKQKPSTIQLFTSFSCLFSFYGFFLLIPSYLTNRKERKKNKLPLASRIQIAFISLILIALVIFGFGSGSFVKDQYNQYTNELVREKIQSIEIEIKQKFGEFESLSISENGSEMDYLLQKLSTVFITDINLYDDNGFLLSSSRPKVFNIGLLSEQMNPVSLNEIKRNKKSELIHQENIGNLDYLSGYVPLYNNEGEKLAILNLQHFGQQKGFEDQIQQFLVAIMNVFILLLALSIIIAYFVSSWLTSPLRILQQSFSQIQLGKYNNPILYEADDEIGTLVKDYNIKLEELAFTTQQLAQSERESAWREMAKQVAHEIKNPLTPMKLSLQHLDRVFDPNDPDSKEKIKKVTASLIEQIDALTKIANEFSNFAKMPKSNQITINLIPIIENVITVFNPSENIEIVFEYEQDDIQINADKDLIIRVFNNLIKNAIQSIPNEGKGYIVIRVKKIDVSTIIEIIDNGIGIPEDMQHKLFVPYFTTKSTGTGLGLAMVKQIIEIHGGKIKFESKLHSGTKFTIELPSKA